MYVGEVGNGSLSIEAPHLDINLSLNLDMNLSLNQDTTNLFLNLDMKLSLNVDMNLSLNQDMNLSLQLKSPLIDLFVEESNIWLPNLIRGNP